MLPDGLYMSGPGKNQFLSYKGSFTATYGAVIGVFSSDIGSDETS